LSRTSRSSLGFFFGRISISSASTDKITPAAPAPLAVSD
jgi:hypothetical protein